MYLPQRQDFVICISALVKIDETDQDEILRWVINPSVGPCSVAPHMLHLMIDLITAPVASI